jgi:trehalose synthase-fused probable maltokinase
MDFTLFEGLNEASLRELLPRLVGTTFPAFLPQQRWFGDKSSVITGVELVHAAVERVESAWSVEAIVEVRFERGRSARYFVPLWIDDPGDAPGIATIRTMEGELSVTDALQSNEYRMRLAGELLNGQGAVRDSFVWSSTTAVASLPPIDRSRSRVSGAQQSNSSVVFDDAVMLKIYRRLSPGVNPEIELGRFLTAKSAFRSAPAMLGSWTWAQGAETISLAVAHRFAPNSKDAWTFFREEILRGNLDDVSAAAELGTIVAKLHLAFETARDNPDLTPERVDEIDAAQWTVALQETLAQVESAMRSTETDPGNRELVETFLTLVPQLAAQTMGFDRLVGRSKIRVHGDLHLGQILVTPEREFLILDFEGEPRRPIAERRVKTSPVKDVAGMLRSFSYARGAVEREEDPAAIPGPADLIRWERGVRRAFLDSYLVTSRQSQAKYLPASIDDVRQAIAAWELDKALYEILYELDNRPDWLAIPLSGTLKLG